jgi:hypothetical protein
MLAPCVRLDLLLEHKLVAKNGRGKSSRQWRAVIGLWQFSFVGHRNLKSWMTMDWIKMDENSLETKASLKRCQISLHTRSWISLAMSADLTPMYGFFITHVCTLLQDFRFLCCGIHMLSFVATFLIHIFLQKLHFFSNTLTDGPCRVWRSGLSTKTFCSGFWLTYKDGDKIGRMFYFWAIVYFGPFFINYRRCLKNVMN